MGEVIYRPLIEDMTWSYSRITCFEDCRYRWFMRYLKDMSEEPQFYASYGSFMHELIERFYRGDLKKEELKTEFLLGFSNKVLGKRPSKKTVANYIEKGINYLEGFQEFPYSMVAVEDEIHFDIDGIPFIGFIDYLGYENGYVVIDNKSRELKPRSNRKKPTKKDLELDDMLKQLYVYSAGVKSKYGEFPRKLCFNCFKNQEFIEEDFTIDRYNNTIDWVKKTVEEIKSTESEDFYPNVEFFGCYYICGLSDDCCYWQQR